MESAKVLLDNIDKLHTTKMGAWIKSSGYIKYEKIM